MRTIPSGSLLVLQALFIMYTLPLSGEVKQSDWSTMNNNYLYVAVACATASLVAYTGCNGIFALERWRVQEEPIPEFLLYSEKDSDISDAHVTIFSHGYGDTYQQVNRYVFGGNHYGDICDKDLILNPFVTFNYPDAAKTVLPVYAEYSSMGQENEIEKLYSVITKIASQCRRVIGVGCSRGSAAWITLFERYPDTKLGALLLESPFDSMERVVDTIIERSKLSWVPGMRNKAQKMFTSTFPLYKQDGLKPLTSIKCIPHDIPVFIVCSREDGLVKAEGSIALYQELCSTGHPKAHLFVADFGKHSKIVAGPSGEAYQNVVHAFYRAYNLPHNEEYAMAGQEIFEKCQPIVPKKRLVFN